MPMTFGQPANRLSEPPKREEGSVVARSNSRVDLGAGLAGGHLNDPHEVEFNRPAGAESTTRPARSQPSCHSPDHMYLADGTAFSRRSATVVRRNVPSSKPHAAGITS
jgi:hypothetical protein